MNLSSLCHADKYISWHSHSIVEKKKRKEKKRKEKRKKDIIQRHREEKFFVACRLRSNIVSLKTNIQMENDP